MCKYIFIYYTQESGKCDRRMVRCRRIYEYSSKCDETGTDVQSVLDSPLSVSRSVRDALSRNVNERQNVCRLRR